MGPCSAIADGDRASRLATSMFRATDTAFALYAVLAASGWAIVVLNGTVGGPSGTGWAFVLGNAAALAMLLCLQLLFRKAAPGRALPARIVATFVLLSFDFSQVGPLIEYLRPGANETVERWLLTADRWLLGVDPTLWLERWHRPVLTEVLQWVYASFFFLPFVPAVYVWRRGEVAIVAKMLFAVVTGFLLSYVGYFFMPARYPLYVIHEPGPLPGVFAAEFFWKLLIDTLEINKFDTFPSGHTEVSLIVLYYAWRYARPTFWGLLPVVSALIFSTVYLRYHYFVDLIAGAALAVFVVAWARWRERAVELTP